MICILILIISLIQYVYSETQVINVKKDTQKTYVTCNAGVDCIVNCIGDSRCEYMSIDANYSQSLKLNCQGPESCYDVKVFAPAVGTNLHIICNTSEYESDTSYYWYYYDGACEYMMVYGNNVENVTIDCYEDTDCYDARFEINNAKYVDINYNSAWSGRYSTIEAKNVSEAFNLYCSGRYSCYGATVYCPYSKYGMFILPFTYNTYILYKYLYCIYRNNV